MWPVGKLLIVFGLILVALGLAVTFIPKFPFPLGRMPGDIFIKRDNFVFSFPIVTCLLFSLILTLLLNFFFRR